jgi:hypothetical protein
MDMSPSEIDRVLDRMDYRRIVETDQEERLAFGQWRSWRIQHGLSWKPCDTGGERDAANPHADC